MTWGIVMLLLSATLGLAVLRPALRAARIDPMNALRCD
jgi:ABC-type lipoprotein release transport system permease subunit